MDHKPLRRIIRRKQLPDITGLSLRRIDELVAKGKFPRPIKLSDGGHAVGYLEDEVLAFQEGRIAARDNAGER